MTIILVILVAIDASALVCYITRFTEENFACLIAFIFIYKAVENVLHIGKDYPLNTAGSKYDCSCLPPGDQPLNTDIVHEWAQYDKKTCAVSRFRSFYRTCFEHFLLHSTALERHPHRLRLR